MSSPVETIPHENKDEFDKGEISHHDNALSSAHERETINEKRPIMTAPRNSAKDAKARHLQLINAKLANPLAGKSKAEIIADVNEFTKENQMEEWAGTFRKGALVAANPHGMHA